MNENVIMTGLTEEITINLFNQLTVDFPNKFNPFHSKGNENICKYIQLLREIETQIKHDGSTSTKNSDGR